jgi:hypothetical protein
MPYQQCRWRQQRPCSHQRSTLQIALVTGEVELAALPIVVAFSGAAEADALMRPIPNTVIAAKMIVRICSFPNNFKKVPLGIPTWNPMCCHLGFRRTASAPDKFDGFW